MDAPGWHLEDDLERLGRVFAAGADEAVLFYCGRILDMLSARAVEAIGGEASANSFSNLSLLDEMGLLASSTATYLHALRRLANDARQEHDMTYDPKPLDTKAIELSDDLRELLERIAEHLHDVWARRRISEGWTWGPERDDAAKKHPDLVAYSELPDSEKEYDRDSVRETLRAILGLGYRVSR